jgi:hypothetical protein
MLNYLCHIQQLLWLYGGLMNHVYVCTYVCIFNFRDILKNVTLV